MIAIAVRHEIALFSFQTEISNFSRELRFYDVWKNESLKRVFSSEEISLNRISKFPVRNREKVSSRARSPCLL